MNEPTTKVSDKYLETLAMSSDPIASELLHLRSQPTAAEVRDKAYEEVLEILRDQEGVEVKLANLEGVNDRQQFVYSVMIVQKLIKDIEQRRLDSTAAKAGGG